MQFADQAVLHGPPVQPGEQRRLGRRLIASRERFEASPRRGEVRAAGGGVLFQDGQGAYRFVQLVVVLAGDGAQAHLAETLEELGVVHIDQERGVSRRLVEDIRGRRVEQVFDAAHIQGDHQHLEGLELHKDGRGNKAIHDYRPPAQGGQASVHFIDGRNVVQGNPGAPQSLAVDRVGRVGEAARQRAHHKTPERVIPGRVPRGVVLHGDESAQVGRQARHHLGLGGPVHGPGSPARLRRAARREAAARRLGSSLSST